MCRQSSTTWNDMRHEDGIVRLACTCVTSYLLYNNIHLMSVSPLLPLLSLQLRSPLVAVVVVVLVSPWRKIDRLLAHQRRYLCATAAAVSWSDRKLALHRGSPAVSAVVASGAPIAAGWGLQQRAKRRGKQVNGNEPLAEDPSADKRQSIVCLSLVVCLLNPPLAR